MKHQVMLLPASEVAVLCPKLATALADRKQMTPHEIHQALCLPESVQVVDHRFHGNGALWLVLAIKEGLPS